MDQLGTVVVKVLAYFHRYIPEVPCGSSEYIGCPFSLRSSDHVADPLSLECSKPFFQVDFAVRVSML